MRCAFEGGNLDGRYLHVDEREMSPYQGHQMCSPDQSPAQTRSHGRCVYMRTERALEWNAESWVVFTHYGDWAHYEPSGDDR
jgi:hypothetical protein